ncbi:MAG: cold shock domain-containing protein [Phycisphaerae bacterium]|nr:cold shock domain-containing protein [Phycisphaerae bacterium]
MAIGRVKWYDKGKGYGFIESPEGDVFFHFSDIHMDGFKALAEDQRVSYRVTHSEQGLKAREIRPLDNRATVRHAARYRTVILMKLKSGCEQAFDNVFTDIPAWFDSFEQDIGVRRIGTWRNDTAAVHLIESDRPYDQSLKSAETTPNWEHFTQWQGELDALLESESIEMNPVQPDEVEEDVESDETQEQVEEVSTEEA